MALLNVGMPGVGLGGIFYLLAALAMPFVELGRSLRARLAGVRRPRAERRWGLALRQATLAAAVLVAAWAAGLAIARWRPADVPPAVAPTAGAPAVLSRPSPVRAGTVAFGVALLAVVVGAVEMLSAWRPAAARATAPSAPRPRRRAEEAA